MIVSIIHIAWEDGTWQDIVVKTDNPSDAVEKMSGSKEYLTATHILFMGEKEINPQTYCGEIVEI